MFLFLIIECGYGDYCPAGAAVATSCGGTPVTGVTLRATSNTSEECMSPAGYYGSNGANQIYIACSANRTSIIGSTNVMNCTCLPSYFGDNGNDTDCTCTLAFVNPRR
jgi:hypothetical protein